MTQFTDYAIADRIDNGFRVLLMEHDAEDNSRMCKGIYEVERLADLALFDDFRAVHHVSHGVGNAIQETDALECLVDAQ